MCNVHATQVIEREIEKKIFKPLLQSIDFICMDLIGEFHPPASREHHYA